MQSPPKHRHDGTSPLPLGMDWSPPPRMWNGRETVWPHDPHTGWSYCVTIPTWVVRPKSRDSDPVVFYRVQVGIQSPEGITTTRGLLRRFNDFLKLSTLLKKAFPRKNLPAVPPKGLLRIKSRALLEERRRSLEEWMTKILSDIDLSRSVAVASFLELEAAARSTFNNENQNTSEGNPSPTSTSSLQVHPSSSLSILTGSSSLASDYGSDTAYETSEIGTPSFGRDNSSDGAIDDLHIDEDLTGPIERLVKYGMNNIDEGLFMGHAILEKLEGLPRNKMRASQINGTFSKAADNRVEQSSEPAQGKVVGHVRKLSNESVESEASSLRGSELSNSGFRHSLPDSLLDHLGKLEVPGTVDSDLQASDVQLVLPLDRRDKLNKVLMTTQRRLMTAKTDMEDLISRLNQEIAVKDYLATKVKDLEVELETTKQKSKEHLQQAILIERERVTQMQWDMEELRHKSFELEMKLKSKQADNCDKETTDVPTDQYNSLLKDLNVTKKQLEDLLERHEELQVKSKSDVKVLVKEVKALRSSQAVLKKELGESQEEKLEARRLLEKEKQCKEAANAVRRKLFNECEVLLSQLQECSTSALTDHVDKLVLDSSSVSDALDLLVTSDNQIDLLLTEVDVLAKESNNFASVDEVHKIDEETRILDDELRRLLKEIFTENARLRKQVNAALRRALKSTKSSEKKEEENGISSDTSVQNTFTE